MNTTALGVLFWLACTLAAIFIAVGRGRSGLIWMLATFFFSPLALLILLALPSRQEAVARQDAAAGASREHRVCPYCAELVRREAVVCKHCRKDLPAAPALAKPWPFNRPDAP